MAYLRSVWHPGHRMRRHLHGAQSQSAGLPENVTPEAAGQAEPFSHERRLSTGQGWRTTLVDSEPWV
jgi:hypothetical protein